MKSLIKRPIISEKSTTFTEAGGYTFEVEPKATKIDIKKEIELRFNVEVTAVNTLNVRGRSKASKYGRGKVPNFKKALVKLKAGQKIALFEGA